MKAKFLLFLMLTAGVLNARLPDLIPYRKGNLWGYCDSTKKIVIEPQWEYTSPFQGATAVVKKNGFYGLIDRSGKAVSSFIYSFIQQDNRNGKRIAGRGKKKVKEGLIDEKGTEIIPCKYTHVYWEWESRKYLRVEDGVSYGEMDASGKLIVPFDYATTRESQTLGFNVSADLGLFVFSKGSGYRFGVVDTNNRVIIPFDFDEVWGLDGGYFYAFVYGSKGKSDTIYVFDKYGKQAQEDDIPGRHSPCQFVPALMTDSANNLYYDGWYDCSIPGNKVHSRKLLYAGYFHAGRASYMTYDSLCGFVNDRFEVVIPAKYGWCGDFTGDSIAQVYALHHAYPEKRYTRNNWYKCFDVEHRHPLGYIDIHGTEYWED